MTHFAAPPSSTTPHSFGKRWLPILLILVSLGIMFGPIWMHYLDYGSDPYRFSNDIRSYGPPAFRLFDPELFVNNYDIEYVDRLSPIGYRTVYDVLFNWFDPTNTTKVLSVVLFFVGLFTIGLASFSLAGWSGAWVSMALVLSSGPHIIGVPRDYAIPILAGALAAVLYGRVTWLAVMILLGAAFYPPVGVLSAFMLIFWLFVWPKTDRGEALEWSFKQRAIFLVATGMLFLAIESRQLFYLPTYGPMMTEEYCQEYPEIGPQGRYEKDSICLPMPPLSQSVMAYSNWALSDQRRGEAWIYSLRVLAKWKLADMGIARDNLLVGGLLIFVLAGVGLHLVHDTVGRRLLLILAAGLFGYIVAIPIKPTFYFPMRYLEKTIPLFLLIALPASAAGLGTIIGSRLNIAWLRPSLFRPAFVILVGCFCLIFLGGQGKQYAGIDKDLTPAKPLMEYLRSLPKDIMIAGWPKGITENIPFVAHRGVLLSIEMHMVLHKNYVDEMRKRTYAVIDAYFATTTAPLIQLREQFGVTHLLLEPTLLEKGKLRHFAPFLEYANKKRSEGRSQGFEILRQIPHAQVFAMKDNILLDLRRLKVNPVQ